jgi:CheY-like chemotaxis protein
LGGRILRWNSANAEHLRHALEHSGHQVICFSSVEEALDLLSHDSNFDLIVSAVHLQSSGLSVFDLLKKVKADHNSSGIPFVFFCSDPGTIGEYMKSSIQNGASILGADKYILMKVFDPHRLCREIELCMPPGIERNCDRH